MFPTRNSPSIFFVFANNRSRRFCIVNVLMASLSQHNTMKHSCCFNTASGGCWTCANFYILCELIPRIRRLKVDWLIVFGVSSLSFHMLFTEPCRFIVLWKCSMDGLNMMCNEFNFIHILECYFWYSENFCVCFMSRFGVEF